MLSDRKQFTDLELFTILEMKDEGRSLGEISQKFLCTRSRIGGVIHRTQQAAGPWDEYDGTMPYGWWRDGLSARTKQGELNV